MIFQWFIMIEWKISCLLNRIIVFVFIQNICCDSCQVLIRGIVSPSSSIPSISEQERKNNDNEDIISTVPSVPIPVTERLRQVEIELAEKKLALTEALCKNQELEHQLRLSISNTNDFDTNSVQSLRANNTNNNNTNNNATVRWLSKTVNTIKEAASSTNRTKNN